MKTARIFTNGGSQAVRLPAEFRFESSEVFIRRDERTGDVILSSTPARSWSDLFSALDKLGSAVVPDDFLADRQQPRQDRDVFGDWKE